MTYHEYIKIQETKLDKEDFLYKINQLSDDEVDKINEILTARDILTTMASVELPKEIEYVFTRNYLNS